MGQYYSAEIYYGVALDEDQAYELLERHPNEEDSLEEFFEELLKDTGLGYAITGYLYDDTTMEWMVVVNDPSCMASCSSSGDYGEVIDPAALAASDPGGAVSLDTIAKLKAEGIEWLPEWHLRWSCG